MSKLTKKQNEVVTLIEQKEKELNKTLYIRCVYPQDKIYLIDIVSVDRKNNKIEISLISELDTRIVNNLLDKNILIPHSDKCMGCILNKAA